MPTTRLSFAIAAVFACSALAQTGKVIYLTHVETPQDLQEVTNVLRSIAEIRDVTPDPAKMSITVHGTADQNALAQWLCGEMDRAAPQPAGTQQYTVPNSDIPIVQVFFMVQMNTPQFLQEAVNAVRSVADIQRFFPYNRLHAVIARGSSEQAAVAGWLLSELDTPAQQIQTPVMHSRTVTLPYSERSGSVVQTFFLSHIDNPYGMQEIVNLTRSIAEIQRLFPHNQRNVLVMRASPDQVALADWMLTALDKPAFQGTAGALEYKVPLSIDRSNSVAQLVFLANPQQPQSAQELLSQIRTTTSIQRVFYDSARNAVAMRGTGDQLARAEQLVKQRDKP